MTARYGTPSFGSRVVPEGVGNGRARRLFELGRIEAGKVTGSQFSRIMAKRAGNILVVAFTGMASGIAVVLGGSGNMACAAIGIDINAAAGPVGGRPAAVAAHPAAGGIGGIITEGAGFCLVCRQDRNGSGRGRVIMHVRIGPGPIMAGQALPGNLRQGSVPAMGAGPVGPAVAGRRSAVRRIVVAGAAIGGRHGTAGRVTALAGQSRPSLKIGAVAEGAGVGYVSGRLVAVGRRPHPVGIGMRRPGGMTIFAAVGQVAHRHVEARIAPRPAVKRSRMALLAICQVGLGLLPVQGRRSKGQCMRRTRSAGMTGAGDAVGIDEISLKTTRRRRIRRRAVLGKIVADAAGGILVAGVAVGRKITRSDIVAPLPAGGVGPGGRMAGRRRAGSGGIASVKLNRSRRAVALLAIGQVRLCGGTVQIAAGKWNPVGSARAARMTAAGDVVAVAEIGA